MKDLIERVSSCRLKDNVDMICGDGVGVKVVAISVKMLEGVLDQLANLRFGEKAFAVSCFEGIFQSFMIKLR